MFTVKDGDLQSELGNGTIALFYEPIGMANVIGQVIQYYDCMWRLHLR